MPTQHRARHHRRRPRRRTGATSSSSSTRCPRRPPRSARSTGHLGRRSRRRGQGAVPRRRRGADVRPAADRAAGPDGRHDAARHRREAAGRGAAGPRPDELDYALEAEAQHAFAVAFRDNPDYRRARRRGARRAGAGHGVARQHQLARGRDPRRHPGGARPLRRAVRAFPVRRPVAHRHAARRPAPRQLPGDPDRRRLPRPARRARLRRRGPAPRRRAAGGDGQPDPDRLPATTPSSCSTGCARRASCGRT